jgi:ribosomal-protein-alanine N-acetyltransferase
MFGINMRVKTEKAAVNLRPACKEDMKELVRHFSSMRIHMYTMGMFARTIEDEEAWYEHVRESKDGCEWLIQPDGYDKPIGVTGLHGINSRENSCTSGIIIWDPSWWGKGVASAAHLGRTLFAADYLNRLVIRSCVRVENNASRKALERVGYTVWGQEPVDDYRAGKWLDTDHLIWFHPEKYQFFYPNGLPEMYVAGVERAKVALEKARKCVEMV